MPVRFTRKYNRNTKDIFDNKFQERIKQNLQNVTQNIAFYCKHNHGFQNRTGALEESINFTPPVLVGDSWQSTVFAGGWARAKYAIIEVFARFKKGGRSQIVQEFGGELLPTRYTTKRKKNVRYYRGQRFNVQRGMGIYVNYAYWVEKRGYPVLIQGIEKFKDQIASIFAKALTIKRYPL